MNTTLIYGVLYQISVTYRRGGGLALKASSVCSDCVFDACYALHGAGLTGAKEAVGCAFTSNNNNANNAGCAVYSTLTIRDCFFEDNSRGSVSGCSVLLSNCVFKANRHNGGNDLLYNQTGINDEPYPEVTEAFRRAKEKGYGR